MLGTIKLTSLPNIYLTFMRVAVIVFLFLARMRFPKSKCIAEVIRADTMRMLSKEFGNWSNLIIVIIKQS